MGQRVLTKRVLTKRERQRARWRRHNKAARERAKERYLKLIEVLTQGTFTCARCQGDEVTRLTIDHVGGCRTYNLRALNPVTRTNRYWEEYDSGVPLRVLCLQCNGEDSNTRNLPEPPF
jgi:hypothetical protein